jgi:hypothetical protein
MDWDDIIRIAQEADIELCEHTNMMQSQLSEGVAFEDFEDFANLVAAHEREECAKWADLVAREIDNTNNTATYIASGIRARGEE